MDTIPSEAQPSLPLQRVVSVELDGKLQLGQVWGRSYFNEWLYDIRIGKKIHVNVPSSKVKS